MTVTEPPPVPRHRLRAAGPSPPAGRLPAVPGPRERGTPPQGIPAVAADPARAEGVEWFLRYKLVILARRAAAAEAAAAAAAEAGDETASPEQWFDPAKADSEVIAEAAELLRGEPPPPWRHRPVEADVGHPITWYDAGPHTGPDLRWYEPPTRDGRPPPMTEGWWRNRPE